VSHPVPLTPEEVAALWAEHDRLRREIEKLDRKFQAVQDRLMEHIMASAAGEAARPILDGA
jgi:hypothetical protein